MAKRGNLRPALRSDAFEPERRATRKSTAVATPPPVRSWALDVGRSTFLSRGYNNLHVRHSGLRDLANLANNTRNVNVPRALRTGTEQEKTNSAALPAMRLAQSAFGDNSGLVDPAI